MEFKEIKINEYNGNPMTMFGEDWALVAAGNEQNGYNAMTIAWGHLGAIWDRNTSTGKIIIPTAEVYIRPQRYTKEFIDREELFTISSFDESYRKSLGYMGSHSGREEDKIAKAGLTPVFADDTTYFEEAKIIFICRKIYQDTLIDNGFLDKKIMDDNYPKKDYHERYVGEIVKILVKE